MDKKNDHKQDEYDFYREVMKKKPLDKRKIAVSAAGVAAGAVLFGVIAAFVFAKSVPYFRPEEEQPRVNIHLLTHFYLYSFLLCLDASYIRIAAATPAFRDSSCPFIGILIRQSA